ncbi:hypothetical protein VCB98_11875 [Gammaproteobacteria bacterium AB-CW1]|uniref:Uncharacterized protein n=1 Tax=Natronospira elongata TaxID=3110268 RepID=A0AAP6MND9_9GAMM|nr:hypothetical protein [Gammaproteobacteria bacterium AB-CW1]
MKTATALKRMASEFMPGPKLFFILLSVAGSFMLYGSDVLFGLALLGGAMAMSMVERALQDKGLSWLLGDLGVIILLTGVIGLMFRDVSPLFLSIGLIITGVLIILAASLKPASSKKTA